MRGILGADIFVNLLLVFIITTGLLLMNTNKTSINGMNNVTERNMPKVQLPQGTSKGTLDNKTANTVTLSANKKGAEIQYFIDDKPVAYSDLAAKFKAKHITSVKIRFDERIPYGQYVRILDLCKQLGITNIYNVYTIETKEG